MKDESFKRIRSYHKTSRLTERKLFIKMTDYQSMYLRLFNVVSDAIEMLQAAQQTAEEIYVNAENSKQSSEAPSLPTESNP